MPRKIHVAIAATALVCAVHLLAATAMAQITVTSPTNDSTVPMPVWVRAHAGGCNGNPSTAFGYSVDNSVFITWGITAVDIDATDYRLNSPGTYVIHFKS